MALFIPPSHDLRGDGLAILIIEQIGEDRCGETLTVDLEGEIVAALKRFDPTAPISARLTLHPRVITVGSDGS